MPRPAEFGRPARIEARKAARSRTVARFEIRHTQFLDAQGRTVGELPAEDRAPERLLELYEAMMLTRLFDQKAVSLQRTGRLGTYASSRGQEATAVAIGAAMAREDVLLGTYRETGSMLVRGVSMTDILLYWGGDARGMAFEAAGSPREDFPICVPIASQAPHAVGVGYAFKLRREPRVAVCVLGDGATSKGDFYEALNAAGVWQLPVVFVVVNNGWAISAPRSLQSHAATLAQKAIAAGFDGEQVDGNDILAVRGVLRTALARARQGGGPCLIEALTYRLADHTTADDARRYRDEAEVEHQRALDPIARLRKYLGAQGLWSENDERQLRVKLGAEVDRAATEYLDVPPLPPDAMFEHLFAQLPDALSEQRDALPKEPGRD